MAAATSLSCVNYVLQRKLEERAAEVARLAEEKKKNARLQRRKYVRCFSFTNTLNHAL